MDIKEALSRNDVPNLTKELIRCALNGNGGLQVLPYESSSHKYAPYSLYGVSNETKANKL